ncbi:MAG: HRDC domain-containing protein [Opitutaceae bacterium]|nr:HRDC domain-containing protein [Opitutaceae bacterium]
MQVSLHTVAPGDSRALDELNRFLRGHRVLTLDREFQAGVWSFCVTYQPAAGAGGGAAEPAPKVDYKEVLDAPTFALFSKLRDVRKALAEQERLPAYAIFTNGQLAEIAKARCATPADLGKIDGIGPARLEKYGAALLAVLTTASLPSPPGGPNSPA